MLAQSIHSVLIETEVFPMAPNEILEAIKTLGEDADFLASLEPRRYGPFFASKFGSVVFGNLIVGWVDNRWRYFVVAKVLKVDLRDHFIAYCLEGFPGPISWDPNKKMSLFVGSAQSVTFLPATPSVIMVLSSHDEEISSTKNSLSEEMRKVEILVAAISGKIP
jgi:hypothetical protein